MRIRRRFSIAFFMLLAGCDQSALIKVFTPTEAESFSRKDVELLRQGKFDDISRDLDPSLVDADVNASFARMASAFPAGSPETVKVVGAHSVSLGDYSDTDITLEYQFRSKWVLVNIVIRKKDNVSKILGFHVEPLGDSLENIDRFSLVGKSADQYLLLIVALGSLAFSCYVFVLCIRTKNGERKWIWLPFVLVGIGKLAVNWTTGQWTVSLFFFQIPCAMARAPLFGPWTVSVGAPVGAVLYLFRNAKIEHSRELSPPADNSH